MKNILITGISKGLGLEIARLLLDNGNILYAINRNLNDDVKVLQKHYPENLHLLAYDLADNENIKENIFSTFIDLSTPIHGFVNNAAVAYDDIVTNLNLYLLESMYRVNVFSPMIMVKYAIRNMLYHQVNGSIVHISSISVHTGYKGLAMYASTKGALEAFSKNTAREWGERKIRSNCIVAGFMESDMNSSLTDEQKNRIYNRTSLKNPTEKLSVAEMVWFLLSDKANSITGQNIFVDSGTI